MIRGHDLAPLPGHQESGEGLNLNLNTYNIILRGTYIQYGVQTRLMVLPDYESRMLPQLKEIISANLCENKPCYS